MVTLFTFGDSILDCGHYNDVGLTPGELLVCNDDQHFPEFRGNDLSSIEPARLEHRAVDGATIRDLPYQLHDLSIDDGDDAAAILTIGGNDLLTGLLADSGPGIDAYAAALDAFVRDLPIRPIFLGNVYDPTFADDACDFTGIDPAVGRHNHQRLNDAIADVASRYGTQVDLHAHFLTGDPSWYVQTIEPSLRGASEVRRCFLPVLTEWLENR